MKKVSFVLHTLSVGGAERRAVSIANYLVNNGFDVEIIILDNSKVNFQLDNRIRVVYLFDNTSSEDVEESNRVTPCCVNATSLPIPNKIKLAVLRNISKQKYSEYDRLMYLRMRYSNKLYEYFRNMQDCTVISWMTYISLSTCYALKKLNNDLIFVECTSPEAEIENDPNIYGLKKKLYNRAQKCICQTDDNADYYNFLKDTKKYVIPNPIIGNYPERYSGERKKIIVDFCRLQESKNIPLLIDAFKLIHDEYPEYQLHIFGEGDIKESLVEYASSLQLDNVVSFFDFDVNIHQRIIDYSMYVSSSNREGMSNSMLESMAIGLPSICTDCAGGAARMLIDNYKNGILIPMNDLSALYEAMKYIIEHPSEAEEMSKNASNIREKLTIENIGNQWINAIME